jgi:hypothetical protein
MDFANALRAAHPSLPPRTAKPRLLIAGGTGVLGNEVLRRLVGSQRYESTLVLAREPITAALRSVQVWQVPAGEIAHWQRASDPPTGDVGVVLFDPPRLYHGRERALFTPTPTQLPDVARWMHACGVRTLAVVLPHAPGQLPEALRQGLANLDEQAVAAVGFDCVLLIRSASAPCAIRTGHALQRLAQQMLSVFNYMVPSSQQPVRAARVAQLVDAALQRSAPGIHVAAPELVWQAAQGDNMQTVVAAWLSPGKVTIGIP